MTVEERIENHITRKNRLEIELGKRNFGNIVDAITKIMKEHNLEMTPTVLSDVFNHIEETVLLGKNLKV